MESSLSYGESIKSKETLSVKEHLRLLREECDGNLETGNAIASTDTNAIKLAKKTLNPQKKEKKFSGELKLKDNESKPHENSDSKKEIVWSEIDKMKTIDDIQKCAGKLWEIDSTLERKNFKHYDSRSERGLYYHYFTLKIRTLCKDFVEQNYGNWYFSNSKTGDLVLYDTFTKKEVILLPKNKIHFYPVDLVIGGHESYMRVWGVVGEDTAARKSGDYRALDALDSKAENKRKIQIIDAELKKKPDPERREFLLLSKRDTMENIVKAKFLDSGKKDIPGVLSGFREIISFSKANNMPKVMFSRLDDMFQNEPIPELVNLLKNQ